MPSSSARNFNLEPDGKRFAVTNHPQCQEDAEPKNELAIISKNLHLPAFLPLHSAERFFALDWAARTQSSANQIAAEASQNSRSSVGQSPGVRL
jgi:hypothetical protein